MYKMQAEVLYILENWPEGSAAQMTGTAGTTTSSFF